MDSSSRSDLPALDRPPAAVARVAPRSFLSEVAVQDAVLAVYLLILLAAVTFGSGAGRSAAQTTILVDLVLFVVGVAVVRGGAIDHALARALVYRATIFGAVFLTYFQLREILPAVSSRAVDGEIVALDARLFGFEPALTWDRFVSPATTEWFAFFYFSYFLILIVNVVPFLLLVRDVLLVQRFALGLVTVYCVGHVVYMLVPGYGPYAYLAGSFEHPLEGGLWWGLVQATVKAGGAQKDIFPSLHTAAPTFLALFAYRHRARLSGYRFGWPVLAVFASQIIVATMFLRWHYLIDIFAGLALAVTADVVAARVPAWEERRRESAGLAPVFEPLLPVRSGSSRSSR